MSRQYFVGRVLPLLPDSLQVRKVVQNERRLWISFCVTKSKWASQLVLFTFRVHLYHYDLHDSLCALHQCWTADRHLIHLPTLGSILTLTSRHTLNTSTTMGTKLTSQRPSHTPEVAFHVRHGSEDDSALAHMKFLIYKLIKLPRSWTREVVWQ